MTKAGDLLLYESSKCRHGRPQRFDGEWYISIIAHHYPRHMKDRALDGHYRVPPHWRKSSVETEPVDTGFRNDWYLLQGTQMPRLLVCLARGSRQTSHSRSHAWIWSSSHHTNGIIRALIRERLKNISLATRGWNLMVDRQHSCAIGWRAVLETFKSAIDRIQSDEWMTFWLKLAAKQGQSICLHHFFKAAGKKNVGRSVLINQSGHEIIHAIVCCAWF